MSRLSFKLGCWALAFLPHGVLTARSVRRAREGKLQIKQGRQDATSSSIDAEVTAAAQALPDGPAKELLSLLRPCAPCSQFKRFGEDDDGGYVMCTDGLDETLEGAFSLGVNGFDGWGMAVSKMYNIPLHEYDCKNSKAPKACEGCDAHFHRMCVGSSLDGAAKENWTTLSDELTSLGLGKTDRSLLLKMDIEGAEAALLAGESVANLRKMRQVVMELHGLSPAEEAVTTHLAVARKMRDAGFVVAHLHGNNCCGTAKFGEFSIPILVEVTYVLEPSGGCSPDLPLHIPLDKPNLIKRKEIDDPVLPPSA